MTLAQWIVESSWGTSRLATTCNNFFGIKASVLASRNFGGVAENYAEFPTWEYEGGNKVLVHALFVRFATEAGCFDAHARLLATTARYGRAMLSNRNPKTFATELQRAGYSTNARYALELIALMNEFNLYQYDAPAVPAGSPAKEIA